LAVGRLLASQLYGIKSYDPLILGRAVVLLAACAMIGGLIPARRAAGMSQCKRCDRNKMTRRGPSRKIFGYLPEPSVTAAGWHSKPVELLIVGQPQEQVWFEEIIFAAGIGDWQLTRTLYGASVTC
jgi:hypothetical protein